MRVLRLRAFPMLLLIPYFTVPAQAGSGLPIRETNITKAAAPPAEIDRGHRIKLQKKTKGRPGRTMTIGVFAAYMFYRNVSQLAKKLHLSAAEIERLAPIVERFPMQIPVLLPEPDRPGRSRRSHPSKMAVPSYFEADRDGSFDTSGEQENTVLPGLQHKYAQTALILSTSKCAMYCRHCFRKRLVGSSDDEYRREFRRHRRVYPGAQGNLKRADLGRGFVFDQQTRRSAATWRRSRRWSTSTSSGSAPAYPSHSRAASTKIRSCWRF